MAAGNRKDRRSTRRIASPTTDPSERRARNVHAATAQPGRSRSRMIVRTSRAGSRRTGRQH